MRKAWTKKAAKKSEWQTILSLLVFYCVTSIFNTSLQSVSVKLAGSNSKHLTTVEMPKDQGKGANNKERRPLLYLTWNPVWGFSAENQIFLDNKCKFTNCYRVKGKSVCVLIKNKFFYPF
jgi:hypothetical protein